MVCDSNCIISPWKAQLNPELMMKAEGGDPVPAGTTCREREREGQREETEGCGDSSGGRLLGTTLYNSSFQELSPACSFHMYVTYSQVALLTGNN